MPHRAQIHPRRIKRLPLAIAAAAVISGGCTGSLPTTTIDPADAMPCNQPAVELQLGSPFIGSRLGEFTVNDSPAWVTVSDIDESGLLEIETGRLRMYIGDATAPPSYDAQRGTVSNVTLELAVHEGQFRRLDLNPGRYWLWQTKVGTAIVASCQEDGVSDPNPA